MNYIKITASKQFELPVGAKVILHDGLVNPRNVKTKISSPPPLMGEGWVGVTRQISLPLTFILSHRGQRKYFAGLVAPPRTLSLNLVFLIFSHDMGDCLLQAVEGQLKHGEDLPNVADTSGVGPVLCKNWIDPNGMGKGFRDKLEPLIAGFP